MTFIQIDSETVLNTDAIDRINFNHIRPNTQNRCIRIELRAIPGLAESRIVLLSYTPELEAALLSTLNTTPIQPVKTYPVAAPFQVSLYSEDWEHAIEDYFVPRIPCEGEYLVLWDDKTTVCNSFQVKRVCHEIPITDNDLSPSRPDAYGNPKASTVLAITPCEPPLRIYESFSSTPSS